VSVVPDEGAVAEFAADSADPPFRVRVRDRRVGRCADDGGAVAAEDVIEGADELARAVADHEPDSSLRARREVAGGLGGPDAGRVGGDAGDVHSARVEFDEEQHVVAAQHDGVDTEEVARHDPRGLRMQECRPRLRRSAWCRIDARSLEGGPHG